MRVMRFRCLDCGLEMVVNAKPNSCYDCGSKRIVREGWRSRFKKVMSETANEESGKE
jgi:DNA-directed RNA polymerase subunit RPC12/RpoP